MYITTQKNLENAFHNLKGDLWIIGSLSDSFESEIIQQMIQEPRWKACLKSWQPLSFEDYRSTALRFGLSITHSEIHREIAIEKIWEYIPPLELFPSEEEAFRHEFLARAVKSGKIYKQLLMKVQAF